MNCYICAFSADLLPSNGDYQIVECKNCGRYEISRTLSSMLNTSRIADAPNLEKWMISGYIRECIERKIQIPRLLTSNLIDILDTGFIPKTVHNKLEKIIKYLSRKTTYFGQQIEVPFYRTSIGYGKNQDEFVSMLSVLEEENYIKSKRDSVGGKYFTLSLKGIEFANSVAESDTSSRKVFVAMMFSDEMKETYRTQIKRALFECGYESLIIDEKHFLNDITDEILVEIKQSNFVIADLTGSRGGVYFEAGFAYGLGKQVIWTCKKEDFQRDKIHFDVEHFPFIVWASGEELYEKLKNRVYAVF